MKCKRLAKKKREKKDGFNQVVDLKLTKNIKGKQKKRWELDEVVYLNNKRIDKRRTEKKDGVG